MAIYWEWKVDNGQKNYFNFSLFHSALCRSVTIIMYYSIDATKGSSHNSPQLTATQLNAYQVTLLESTQWVLPTHP